MSSTPATPRGGSVRSKLFVNTVLALSFLYISAPLVSGVPLHEWISIAVVVVVVAHVVLSWNWVVAVTRRFRSSLRGQVRFNYVWDLLLYASFIIAMVSGLAVSEAALPALGIPYERDRFWTLLHKVSGFGMMSAAGVHLAMHWEWVTAAVGRLLAGRLPSAPARAGSATWWLGPTIVLSIIVLATSAASYAAGMTPLADRIRSRGAPARAAGAGGRAEGAGLDSAARAERRAEIMRRRRAREARQGGADSQTANAAPSASTPAEQAAGAQDQPRAEGANRTRARGGPAAREAKGSERPRRPSLALRSYRTLREIGLFMGLPFVLTLGALVVVRRSRVTRAQPAIDPLDESGE